MRCSTCGEALSYGQERCPTCGAVVPPSQQTAPVPAAAGVRQCPRCGVQGFGIPYFKRAGHVCLLVGLSLFTYGLGGVVYYASRRKHLVCRGCGLGWEHAREPGTEVPLPMTSTTAERSPTLPASGIGRRVIGAGLALFATLLITVGIVEFEPAAIAVGSVVGLMGSGSFWWGWKALQERRQAVLQDLNRQVLLLASERKGVLTVTEVATALNLSMPAAEQVLEGLDDGFRVRSDISKEGVLYYEFPELRHQKKLRASEPA